MMQHFLGQDGFYFWFGFVENRMDPLKLGRAQVRICGWHSANKSQLPTDQLLWAHPVLPLNSTSEIIPPKEGTQVFGFFLDGDGGQHPIMLGQLPNIPTATPNPSDPFADSRTDSQLQNAPRLPQNLSYSNNGDGVSVTESKQASNYPNILNEPTTSRLARNENIENTIIQVKNDNLIENVPIASGTQNNNQTWSQPKSGYNTTYPYNKVTETESGHVIEIDDTPGAERIQIYHRTGTFEEINPDGSKITKVVKNNINITLGNENELVYGSKQTNVSGTESTLTTGDRLENVNGNKNVFIQGNYNLIVGEASNITIYGDLNATIQGNMTATVNGQTQLNYDGTATYKFPLLLLQGDVVIEGNMSVVGGESGGVGNITVNGQVSAIGDVTAGNISVMQHEHTGVQRGGASTDPPVG